MGWKEYLYLLIVFGIPGFAGARLAHSRGKNPWLWGLISAPLPIFAFILWFKKPEQEVEGHFRKCNKCGGIYPWRYAVCRYCGTAHD